MAHPFWFGLTAFLGTMALFILPWLITHTRTNPLVMLLLMAILTFIIGWIILKVLGNQVAISPKHQFALAAGALIFLFCLELSRNWTKIALIILPGWHLSVCYSSYSWFGWGDASIAKYLGRFVNE
jgi:hypothetical protein